MDGSCLMGKPNSSPARHHVSSVNPYRAPYNHPLLSGSGALHCGFCSSPAVLVPLQHRWRPYPLLAPASLAYNATQDREVRR